MHLILIKLVKTKYCEKVMKMESLAVSQLLGELLDACQVGDDDVVKNILEGGMVDINGVDLLGLKWRL